MKAADVAHVLEKVRRDLAVATRDDTHAQIDPLPLARWEAHIKSLRTAIEVLQGDPARLLTDEQLLEAIKARDLLPELAGLLEVTRG